MLLSLILGLPEASSKERGSLVKDDRADVLSMAVQYWVDTMDRDTRKAEEDHRAHLLDLELAKFHTQVLGGNPHANSNWCNRR